MSDEELRDELVTLLVAGHETTANALAWAVERLCRHPEKLQRLADEVRRGERGYLEAVVQETLRLRPVISIVLRRLVEPMEIGGRLLPAGASIVPSIHLVHRRADIYPQPHEFRPERFLEQEAAGRRGPTRGSRLVEACAAVWVPPSPSLRWSGCYASSSCDARSPPRGRNRRAFTAARSPRRHATTLRCWWGAARAPQSDRSRQSRATRPRWPSL